MKCPHLQESYHKACNATRGNYVPSQFEFEEYCQHNNYGACPLYLRAAGLDQVVPAARSSESVHHSV